MEMHGSTSQQQNVVARQVFVTQAYTLLVFAGIWALLHGVTDIVKSFQIKRLG